MVILTKTLQMFQLTSFKPMIIQIAPFFIISSLKNFLLNQFGPNISFKTLGC